MIAATTPNGSAISMIFFSSMRLITPTVFIGLMNSWTRCDANRFFCDLVGDDAEARLFDGEARERLGLRRHGRGHGIDDGVDLGLRELGEDELRVFRAARERARFGNGSEIFVGLRGSGDGSHRLRP